MAADVDTAETSALLPELTAMQALVAAIEPLEADERLRVLRWAADRYGAQALLRADSDRAKPLSRYETETATSVGSAGHEPTNETQNGAGGDDGRVKPTPSTESHAVVAPPASAAVPASSAELLAASHARTDAQRALVIAYWFQVGESRPDLDAMTLNRELKNLGHGVSNITGVLTRMMESRPQLVLQLKKSGSSRQARKKYKLTAAGRQRVESLLGAPRSDSDDTDD